MENNNVLATTDFLEQLKQSLVDELEEYGQFHDETCLYSMQVDPDECDCRMSGLKPLFQRMYEAGFEKGRRSKTKRILTEIERRMDECSMDWDEVVDQMMPKNKTPYDKEMIREAARGSNRAQAELVRKIVFPLEEIDGEGTNWGICLGHFNPEEDHFFSVESEDRAFEISDKLNNFIAAECDKREAKVRKRVLKALERAYIQGTSRVERAVPENYEVGEVNITRFWKELDQLDHEQNNE